MALGILQESPDSLSEPLWFGGYRVVERIAEGGTATVFRAEDPETGQQVALKTVRTGLPHEIAVLTHEIEILRRLRNPGIVRFLGSGDFDGTPWMALELLPGRNLFEVIDQTWPEKTRRPRRCWANRGAPTIDQEAFQRYATPENRGHAATLVAAAPRQGSWASSLQENPALAFPSQQAAGGHLEDALIVLLRLIAALDYIHSRGVVHGDLKPPNVQLGDDGRVTLLDFGAAYRPGRGGDPWGADGFRIGTVEYAAPELITGQKLDVTTDIYSLGCLLYEMLTGRIPFDGASHQDIGQKHLDEEPVGPTRLVSGISWALEELVMDMLAKRPNRRPRSVRVIAARIAPLLRPFQRAMRRE